MMEETCRKIIPTQNRVVAEVLMECEIKSAVGFSFQEGGLVSYIAKFYR